MTLGRTRPDGRPRTAIRFRPCAVALIAAIVAGAGATACGGRPADSGYTKPAGSGDPAASGQPGGSSPAAGSGTAGPGSRSAGGPTSPGQSTGSGQDPGVTANGPAASLIPVQGAYLGAYVQPAEYTAASEIAAVQAFQRSVGHPIDLVHVYHRWDQPFPDLADRHFVHSGKVLLLTWSGTPDTKKIISGAYDSEIRARAEAVKQLGRPILMEFRHEMDRPNLQWAVHGPKDYIAAWDHIRAIFAQVGATNVGWVWCPTGYGFWLKRAQPFYPGNNEVDWVCADIYAPITTQSLEQVAKPFLTWAKNTHKPILIGEFAAGPFTSQWPAWLRAAGELAKSDPQIKGMAYFDANGTDSNGHPFAYWLGNNQPALAAFGALLGSRYFQPAVRTGAPVPSGSPDPSPP